MDSNGRRALEYAAQAKHKAAMEMLALHGAQATHAVTLDSTPAARSRTTITVKTETSFLTHDDPLNETKEEFECRIALAVDIFKFGIDGAKSIDDLFHEVQNHESVIQPDHEDGVLKRYLSVVK